MKLAYPELLLLLLLAIPALAVVLFLLAAHRQRMCQRIADPRLFRELVPEHSEHRRRLKDFLLLAAVALSVAALARPQWGFEWQKVQRQGIDIFLAIDTSHSMLTADVRPNRLERVKLAVRDLLDRLKGDRVGIVAFAGSAFTVCPLTSDYSGFRLVLDSLSTDIVPLGGTDIARAIREALRAYADVPSRYKVLVIITDGENWEGDPVAAAKEAAAKGIRIYTVGVGTKEGEMVRVASETGQEDFLRDKAGNAVKSRLNENMLKEIAAVTGGSYVRSGGGQSGLDYLYDREFARMEKRDIESSVEKKYHERYQWLLFPGLVLLLAESLMTARRVRT